MQRELEVEAGTVGWMPAQQHRGVNIVETASHVIFVELKEPGADFDAPRDSVPEELGPQ